MSFCLLSFVEVGGESVQYRNCLSTSPQTLLQFQIFFFSIFVFIFLFFSIKVQEAAAALFRVNDRIGWPFVVQYDLYL